MILPRATCIDQYGRTFYCSHTWSDWGRWLVVGLCIFGILTAFFLLTCISARRRRKRGAAPMYGTGWAGGPNQAPNQQWYNGNQQQPHQGDPNSFYAPAPPYTPKPVNYSGRGEQENGVELSRPQDAYQPPPGPPPGR